MLLSPLEGTGEQEPDSPGGLHKESPLELSGIQEQEGMVRSLGCRFRDVSHV